MFPQEIKTEVHNGCRTRNLQMEQAPKVQLEIKNCYKVLKYKIILTWLIIQWAK